jgi:hypothetical protein
MADTIIGTAGIFFTLVLIAAASFLIGLIVYGVADLVKSLRGQHRHRHHHHSAYQGPVTVSPVALADRLHRAAQFAAAALIPVGAAEDASPAVVARWRIVAEWMCGLLHVTEAHIEPRLRRAGQSDTFVRALTDLCAGNLFRSHPGPCDAPVHRLLAEGRTAFAAQAAPKDLFEPAPAVYRLLAERIAPHLPTPIDGRRLQETVSDLVRSAVTLDIAPCLK